MSKSVVIDRAARREDGQEGPERTLEPPPGGCQLYVEPIPPEKSTPNGREALVEAAILRDYLRAQFRDGGEGTVVTYEAMIELVGAEYVTGRRSHVRRQACRQIERIQSDAGDPWFLEVVRGEGVKRMSPGARSTWANKASKALSKSARRTLRRALQGDRSALTEDERVELDTAVSVLGVAHMANSDKGRAKASAVVRQHGSALAGTEVLKLFLREKT